MKHLIHLSMFFLIISLFLVSVTQAQEEPKYNFGSAQPGSELIVSPGDSVKTKLYFYNIYGNRITHISLSVLEAPENWDISIQPPLHTTTVNVSGVITEISENLHVEPSEALDKIPEDVPEGIEYISSSVGYIGARPVEITISVPEDEQVGTSHSIVISGIAEWVGQTGTAAIKQSRNFEYTVNIVPAVFEEQIIEEFPEEQIPQEVIPLSRITGFVVANTLWIGLTTLLVLIILGLTYFSFIRKSVRRREFRYKR